MSLDPRPRWSDSALPALSLQLDDLPVDVFEVAGCGLTVESLTGGHGMTETGGSCQHCGVDSPYHCPCSCYPA